MMEVTRLHVDSVPGLEPVRKHLPRLDSIAALGNLEILQSRKLALFCSVRCPGKIILATHDYCQELAKKSVTVVGGFHSPVERECLNILLRGTGAIIICPARGLNAIRIAPEIKAAMDQGRVLYLSPFKAHQRRGTAQMAGYRNSFVAALADSILVAYACPGGKTEQLCRQVLSSGKIIHTLESKANANLIALGARAIDPKTAVPF
jgi:predicted Rossmann fold nucleotide-binding protein DprA/Smf involved in DNA uptake